MREIIEVPRDYLAPSLEDVMLLQGIPTSALINDRIMTVYRKAFEIYEEKTSPKGLIGKITAEAFEDIISAPGGNIINSVISGVYRKSGHLALYVFTLGHGISDTIRVLFDQKEFALGSMLDSIASSAADRGGEYGESVFLRKVLDSGASRKNTRVLMYSPGYCGWDISGQQELFRVLKPEEIGVTLNESSLMSPLKTVSGVLVAGEREIHYIKEDFDFCRTCTGKNCRDRIKRIKKEA